MPPKKTASKTDAPKKVETQASGIPSSDALKKMGTKSFDAATQVAGQLQDAGKKAISNFGGEVVKFEKSIMQLPIGQKLMFFAGVIVLLSVLFGAVGKAILIVLGVFMIISGIKGNDIFLRLGASEEKKK